jgi:hypothetical protein
MGNRNRKWMPLDEARAALLTIWMSGGGLVLFILMLQSMFGRYGTQLQSVWSWFIPTVVPSISLMLGVLGATALVARSSEPKSVRVFFFQVSRYLSVFYLSILLLTVAVEPFTRVSAVDLYTMSNYWLGPVQGLVVAALGVLFVSKEDHPADPAGAPPASGDRQH